MESSAKKLYGNAAKSQKEKNRKDLAACFRLCDRFGWEDPVFKSHLTMRCEQGSDSIFTNSFYTPYADMREDDIVAVPIPSKGHGGQSANVDESGLVLHREIYKARPDVNCVLHIHASDSTAVSNLKEGLLPLSQPALMIRSLLAYHSYPGLATETVDAQKMASDIGDKSLLLLRNHGVLSVAATLPRAFVLMYLLEQACEIQVKTLSMNRELIEIPSSVQMLVSQQVSAITDAELDRVWEGMIAEFEERSPA